MARNPATGNRGDEMKSTITIYVHQKPGQAQRIFTADMSPWPDMFGALLGTFDVEIEWQEIAKNPTLALLDALQVQLDREHVEHQTRVEALTGKMNDLRSLEHKGDAI